jgi:hypothetical protein
MPAWKKIADYITDRLTEIIKAEISRKGTGMWV